MLLIQVTAAYSNAVLVAVLPHISNFENPLQLPVPMPITAAQIAHCNILPYVGEVGCGIWLTNDCSFGFSHGYVGSFQSPTDWFKNQYDNWDDSEYFKRYLGKESMTTNEAIEFARRSFYKLGYQPKDFDIRCPPTSFEGPVNTRKLGHFPFCRVEWESPKSKIQNWLGLDYSIQFDIYMQRKQIVGMDMTGRRFWRPEPKVDVVPTLETDYRRAGRIGMLAQRLAREPAVHITVAYSNATLSATLPYIARFGRDLNLPGSRSLAENQVLLYRPPLYYTNDGFTCSVMLTNHFWFIFLAGFVTEFSSPDDWFDEAETRNSWPRFDAKTCMSTNEAIQFARQCFRQLNYQPRDFYLDRPPTRFESAVGKDNKRYAYCRVDWESPDGVETNIYQVQFDIDLTHRQVVGATLISQEFMRPLPGIASKPELESDYQKRIQGHMFIRTNAAIHLPADNPAGAPSATSSE